MRLGIRSPNIPIKNESTIGQKNLYADDMQCPNSVAKQQIVAKPVEHVTTAYACVMVKIGIFIAFIDWQVQLDKRDLLQ